MLASFSDSYLVMKWPFYTLLLSKIFQIYINEFEIWRLINLFPSETLESQVLVMIKTEMPDFHPRSQELFRQILVHLMWFCIQSGRNFHTCMHDVLLKVHLTDLRSCLTACLYLDGIFP